MLTTNAIKKLKALPNFKDDGRQLSAQVGSYVVSCYRNGGPTATTVTCFHTQHVADKSDMMTDYHAGTYWDNLTQAIASVLRSSEREAAEMEAGLAAARVLDVPAPTTRMEAHQLVDRLHKMERAALAEQARTDQALDDFASCAGPDVVAQEA